MADDAPSPALPRSSTGSKFPIGVVVDLRWQYDHFPMGDLDRNGLNLSGSKGHFREWFLCSPCNSVSMSTLSLGYVLVFCFLQKESYQDFLLEVDVVKTLSYIVTEYQVTWLNVDQLLFFKDSLLWWQSHMILCEGMNCWIMLSHNEQTLNEKLNGKFRSTICDAYFGGDKVSMATRVIANEED